MSQVSIIDIEGTHPQIPTYFDANVGFAIPIANVLEIYGDTSAAGVTPVYTEGSGNTITTFVQTSQAIAATDATKIGLSAFDSADFTVDANGFVTLAAGAATGSFNVDAATAPGTDPVTPTVGGLITVTGAQVASGTVGANVIRTDSLAANAYTIEIQRSTTSAASNLNVNGVSHFDSSSFAVDGNGFVTLSTTGAGKTITGDSGGALSPVANNWNILGLSGSKTSGSAATLTIKSPPYADQAAPTTVTLNSGSFATAAITLTTPLTAGLADGDLLEFVGTNGVLVIQLSATQVGHLGSAATSAAGTFTSSATGDSISLRYQASTNDWWATSAIGIWILA